MRGRLIKPNQSRAVASSQAAQAAAAPEECGFVSNTNQMLWPSVLVPLLLATSAASRAAVLDQAAVNQALDGRTVTTLQIALQGATIPQGGTLVLSGGSNTSAALSCQAPNVLTVKGRLVLQNLTANLAGASPWIPSCVELSPGASLVLHSVLLIAPCISAVQLPAWSLCQQPANFRGVTVSDSLITVTEWSSGPLEDQHVNASVVAITCAGNALMAPALGVNETTCAGRIIESNVTFVPSILELQRSHQNVTLFLPPTAPLCLSLDCALPQAITAPMMTSNMSLAGNATILGSPPVLNLTGNIAVVGTDDGLASWVDFGGNPLPMNIQPNATLKFQGVTLINLNLGPDTLFPTSSFVAHFWSIAWDRSPNAPVSMLLCEVTVVYPEDVYQYLAYWFSQWLSPITSVAATAKWLSSGQNGAAGLTDLQVAVTQTGQEQIINTLRKASGSLWTNVTMLPAKTINATLLPAVAHTGIMDWGTDPYTPPIEAVTVCTPSQLANGLQYKGQQQYVIQACNISAAPTAQLSASADPPALGVVPAGASIWWQGHPLRSGLSVDFAGLPSLTVAPGAQLRIRNLTIYNGGVASTYNASNPNAALQNYTSALWAISGVSSEQMLILNNVTIVVPLYELMAMMTFAQGALNCNCSLAPAEQDALVRLFSTAQVSQVTNTSIVFTTVHGWRWSGTRVTVTSDVSRGSFTNVLTPNPIVFQSTNTGQQSASSSSSSSVDVRWVVPVVVVGGLLLLAGLGLVTAAVLRRSRQSKAHQQYQGKDIAAVQEEGLVQSRACTPQAQLDSSHDGSTKALATPLIASTGGSAFAALCTPDTGRVPERPPCGSDWLPEMWQSGTASPVGGIQTPHSLLMSSGHASTNGHSAPPGVASPTGSNTNRPTLDGSRPLGVVPGGVTALMDSVRTLPVAPGSPTHISSGASSSGSSHLSPSSPSTMNSHHGLSPKGLVSQGSRLQQVSSPLVTPGAQEPAGPLWGVAGGKQPLAVMDFPSIGRRSDGSSSQMLAEESSLGMMSDSFEKPGSEYGDMRSLDMTESDEMLQQVRSEVGDNGRLVIFGVLGAGAQAVVYRGEWRGRPVAVKTMLFSEHRAAIKRQAMQEAAINTRLTHPNIVNTMTYELKPINSSNFHSTHSGGLTIAEDQQVTGDWKLYIVQEYCDAGHLKRAVDTGTLKGPTGEPFMLSVVQIALDIACGVSHIHSKNIIHGDLSPANVLLKTDENRVGILKAVAKVGDFGLSRTIAAGKDAISGVRQGTPFYTAPEVLTQGRISKACDVYSFGVILHELYCGQPAWRQRIQKQQKADQAAAINKSNESVPVTDQASAKREGSREGGDTGAQTTQASASAPDSPAAASSAAAQGGAGSQHHDAPALLDMSNPPALRSGPETGALAHSLSSSGQDHGLQAVGLSAPESQGAGSAASGCDGGVSNMLVTSATEMLVPPAMPTPQETLKAMQRFLTIPEGTCPLVFPPSCPQWYAQLASACMDSQPENRPKLFDVVKTFLTHHEDLAKAFLAEEQEAIPL